MKPLRWIATAGMALLMLLGYTRALAQEIDVGGQVRPRFESRDQPDVDADGDGFVSMRTRLGLGATLTPITRAFVQIQDVRLWGSETSTMDGVADQLDLHQAWIELGRADASTLRIGRQEARYGAERLVGAVDWVQTGRAFDGARASLLIAGVRVDALGFQVADQTAGHAEDAALAGVYATVPRGAHTAEVFGLWNSGAGTSQTTAGGRWLGRAGVLSWRAEGAWQFGERASRDVAAHLLSGELGVDVVDGVTVGALYDRLSGDDDPADDEVRVFDTLFATNHKFYGFADVFLNIPLHTGGRGLQDLALRTGWKPSDVVTITLDLHRFLAAADAPGEADRFADEADLVVAWRHSTGLAVSGGLFLVDPAPALAAAGGPGQELLVTYFALDATF